MATEQALDGLALARLYYANYCEMWRAVGAVATDRGVFDVQQRTEMLVVRSVLTSRIPNMILQPAVVPAVTDRWIARIVDELGSGPPSLLVAIAPGDEQTLLATLLQREGFRPTARPLVAMAVQDLRALPLPPADPSFALARSTADLREARLVLSAVFGLPVEVFAFYTPPALVRTYVLRRGGNIVAALCLCLCAATAGVYSVAVVPAARRQGLATILVRCALTDAADQGVTTAVLSCEHSLVPWYQTLGFQRSRTLVQYWYDAWWR